jgi:hypothetical protein
MESCPRVGCQKRESLAKLCSLASLAMFHSVDCSSESTTTTTTVRLTPNQPLLFQGYSNRLNGTIPDLFATHQFAYFNFDNNALSGTIPSSISRQSALTHLNISHNLLSGTFSAPRVRDFCVIDHNQFDSCIENSGAIVPCCRPASTNRTDAPASATTMGPTSTGSDSSQTLDSTAPSDAVQQPSTTATLQDNNAALIGGVVGAILLLLLVAVAAFLIMRKLKQRRQPVILAGSLPSTPNAYTAPPPRQYNDIDDVRRPVHF